MGGMESLEPISFPGRHFVSGVGGQAATVAFDRFELQHILNVYGRMVAAGHWKDYAIGDSKEVATFCIFRRASEMPLYRITKTPRLQRKQGQYAILGMAGQILKRGHDLAQLMSFFDKKRFRVVD